jgi:hygromycin-B 7''-O-kinase
VLPSITSEKEYSVLLGQLEPWRDAVQEVLRKHELTVPDETLRLGRRATYPTVLAGDDHVVKLFGPWWSGPESLEAELASYAAVAGRGLPVPALRAHGQMDHGWSYLVLEQLRGRDLLAVRDELDGDTLVELAAWLGRFCRALKATPLAREGYLSSSWDRFNRFLATRREEVIERDSETSRYPPHLQKELGRWLPDVGELIDASRGPVLLHGDLHDHHVFGTVKSSAFVPTGIIDFTDALTGDPYYEIGPLFVHTFRAEPRLLAAWAAAADLPAAGVLGFPKRALAYTILHEFEPLIRLREDLALYPTLDAVADELFRDRAG